MKKTMLITATLVLFGTMAPCLAETVVKEQPLTWQQVGHLDGDGLYTSLCAACHGAGGVGNGPAADALGTAVPDLTRLAARNDGTWSHKSVEMAIAGESREVSHHVIGMPGWQQQFMYLRPGLTSFQREAFARNRIHALTEHLEGLQVAAN